MITRIVQSESEKVSPLALFHFLNCKASDCFLSISRMSPMLLQTLIDDSLSRSAAAMTALIMSRAPSARMEVSGAQSCGSMCIALPLRHDFHRSIASLHSLRMGSDFIHQML